ncbi:hypothetical protein R1flu_021574 [Riccia fluitans]|uniref:PAN deadenylation complex subunit 3 n=1 Tax=Riccia fluitans TaxID=41844 RepID=A0ABD1ZPS6_9MARC
MGGDKARSGEEKSFRERLGTPVVKAHFPLLGIDTSGLREGNRNLEGRETERCLLVKICVMMIRILTVNFMNPGAAWRTVLASTFYRLRHIEQAGQSDVRQVFPAAMSAPHQKLPASSTTCRYWATSGTCFFGDQCNFAHNTADKATSGKAVPKREKACKELLLTGYCKNENDGCEYNHSIPGVTRSGPPTPTTTGVSTSATSSTWNGSASRATTTTTSGAAGVSAVRTKGLPVTAPAFVPAAVAAAQRASLTAWGGLTPGGGSLVVSVNQPPAFFTSTSLTVSSSPSQNGSLSAASTIVGNNLSTPTCFGRSLGTESRPSSEGLPKPAFVNGSLPASMNAQPFVPSDLLASSRINGVTSVSAGTSSGSSIGNADAPSYVPSVVASAIGAPPYIPKSKQHVLSGVVGAGRSLPDQSHLGIGGTPQQLQLRQQLSQLHLQEHQAAHMLAVAARSIGGNAMSTPYVNMDVPMVMPPFRLPDGDDPALGMTAMSPPNPAFVIPLTRATNGSIPVLPAPETLASMGIVGDGSGGLQVGNGFPSQMNYGTNLQSQSSGRVQQIQQHMQKLQMQHPPPPLQVASQTHPFTLRTSQGLEIQKQQYGATPSEKHLLKLASDLGTGSDSRNPASSPSVAPTLFTGDSQAQDILPSLSASLDSQQTLGSDPAPEQQQQQTKPQQQQTAQPLQSPAQLLQTAKQRQHQLQQQQMLQHQQHMQLMQQRPQPSSQRPITSPVQHQQRLPFRSLSPVANVASVAASAHGGATYFHSPGQVIGGMPHVTQGGPFTGSTGRVEGRIRGQSNIVRLGHRYMADQLREELRRRHALIHAQLDTDQNIINLPEMVQRFHTLYPLEDVNRDDDSTSCAFGVRSMILKGISSTDGITYAIRRIDSRQVIPNAELAASAAEVVERWSPLARHPHIVAIREAFVSREIEDSAALFFVHDYYPGSVTLEAMHLHQEQSGGVAPVMISEEQLWSYLVQLAAALRAVHSAGLFFRPGGLHPSKVILPTRGRLRVSSAGILNVLNGDSGDDPRAFQREDLAGLGRLILSLACGSTGNPSLEFMAAHYSGDLVHVTNALLASSLDKSEGVGISNIRQLHHVLTEHMFGEIESLHLQNDELMSELSKETENGRLLRILIKLGMTNERPEDGIEAGWSESGDRSLLKLFRDFIFHQTTKEGSPLIDWGHVIDSLNKLDAGVPEKMILLSRDERSMLFASYGDVKRCLDSAYQELVNRDKGRSIILGVQSPTVHNPRLKQRQAT